MHATKLYVEKAHGNFWVINCMCNTDLVLFFNCTKSAKSGSYSCCTKSGLENQKIKDTRLKEFVGGNKSKLRQNMKWEFKEKIFNPRAAAVNNKTKTWYLLIYIEGFSTQKLINQFTNTKTRTSQNTLYSLDFGITTSQGEANSVCSMRCLCDHCIESTDILKLVKFFN